MSNVNNSSPNALAFYGSAIFVSLLMGMIASFSFPVLTLLPVALVAVVVLAFKLPEFVVVLIYCSLYGLIPASLLPAVSVGGGKLLIHEAFLALLLLSLLVSRSGQFGKLLAPAKILAPGVLLISFLWMISFFYAKFFAHTPINNILTEGRDFAVLSLIFFVPLVCSSPAAFKRLVILIAAFSVVLAFVVVLQSFFHLRLIEMSRVEDLNTMGQKHGGITRVITEGIYFLIFSFYLLFLAAHYKLINRLLASICMVVLLLGVLVSFGRGVWATSILGFLWVAWIVGRWALLARLTVIGGALLTFLLAALALTNPDMLAAMTERFLSIGSEVQSGSSLGWRLEENSFAFKALMHNPFVGVGLGGDYKPVLDHFGFEGQTRYIHNGYLYLALKFGVLGILFPILMAYGAIRLFNERKENHRENGGQLVDMVKVCAMGTIFVTLMITFTQPEWMVDTGLTFIATAFGVLVAATRQTRTLGQTNEVGA